MKIPRWTGHLKHYLLFCREFLVFFCPYPSNHHLIRCYHSGPEWTWEWWQWRGTQHSPKLQHYWNLTIRLFTVISRTLIVRSLTPLQRSNWCILQPQVTGQYILINVIERLMFLVLDSQCSYCRCKNHTIFLSFDFQVKNK